MDLRLGVVLSSVVVLGALPEDPKIRAGLQLHRMEWPVWNAAPMQRFYLCGFRSVAPGDTPWGWLVGTYEQQDAGMAAYAEHREKLLDPSRSRDSFWANGRTAVWLPTEATVMESFATEIVEMPGYRGVSTYRAPDPVPSPPLWVPKFRTPPAERDEMPDGSILQKIRAAGSRWWMRQLQNDFAPDRSAEPPALPLPGGVLTWEPPPSPGQTGAVERAITEVEAGRRVFLLRGVSGLPPEGVYFDRDTGEIVSGGLRSGDTLAVTATVQFEDQTPATASPARPTVRARDEEDEEVTFDGYS